MVRHRGSSLAYRSGRVRAYTPGTEPGRGHRLLPRLPAVDVANADSALRRELYFFTLYRLLEAALLVFVLFGPIDGLVGEPRHDIFARSLSLAYLALAALLFAFGRRGDLQGQALAGIATDLAFGILAIHAVPGAGTGIALMLMFNVGAAALLLRTRYGLSLALVAVIGIIGEFAWTSLVEESEGRRLAEPIMFSIGYLAIATLTSVLGRQMRAAHALAEHRGHETAHLVEVNELIIRRLRTGVLLVDGHNRVRLANEAATLLLGEAGDGQRTLDIALPELAERLAAWREGAIASDAPLQISPDQPEVVPRFTRLLAASGLRISWARLAENRPSVARVSDSARRAASEVSSRNTRVWSLPASSRVKRGTTSGWSEAICSGVSSVLPSTRHAARRRASSGSATPRSRWPSPASPSSRIAASLASRTWSLPSTSSTPVRRRRMISSLTSVRCAVSTPRRAARSWLARIWRPRILVRVAMAR